ncbi:MAG: PTS sugar transporter subunit IIC [Butyricicoccus sp.]
MTEERRPFMDRFAEGAAKLGNQIHLKTLRDAFATIMPLYILAGLAVLVNNVIFVKLLSGAALEAAKYWGTLIINGTLSISGLMIAPTIGFFLSRNRRFGNPFAAAMISLASLIVMMPLTISAKPVGAEDAVMLEGLLSFGNLGTNSMFAGIIIGLLSTELFIRISNVKRLQINLGDSVPQAVGDSFNVLIPVILVLSSFGIVSTILAQAFHTDLISLISTMIQAPLKNIGTSLAGCLILYTLGNLLFTQGIHQSVIYSSILEPLLIVNMTENMAAFAAGEPIPNIINVSMVPGFGMLGGSGSTICLVIATLLFSKYKPSRDIVKMASVPSLFNINEPMIFGYPIVFNYALVIPFIAVPALGITIAYFATTLGLMNPCVVQIPWTTPPLMSGFLATGGDWRAIIVQAIIIVLGVLIYLPFMKASEKVQMKMMEAENED